MKRDNDVPMMGKRDVERVIDFDGDNAADNGRNEFEFIEDVAK